MTKKKNIQLILEEAVQLSRSIDQGKVADYIPELASINPELIGVSVRTCDGESFYAGDVFENKITLQSAAKLVILIGMLEEFGSKKVFSWVKVEPSGDDFNSVARLDQFGPVPSNPMLNSGAIALCNFIPGNVEEQQAWLERWMTICFGERLRIDAKVLASERRTGDRNRSLAYLMKSNNIVTNPVDQVLESYFSLCSFESSVQTASYLPLLLANDGRNLAGQQVISHDTVKHVLSIMATCGLYNEAGTHLVRTGMPAKSSVSGFILASAMQRGGIAVFSPRVNRKGTSIRGEMILEYLSDALSWHFADPVVSINHAASNEILKCTSNP